MVTAVISDLHLGLRSSLLDVAEARERLFAEIEHADRLVVLGDLLSLRARPAAQVLEMATPFLAGLRDALGDRPLVVVAGNHDHCLAAPLLERSAAEPRRLELDRQGRPGSAGMAGALAARLSGVDLTIAYPGLWIAPGVYATHGHYLDCHFTLPRLEAVCAAALARASGRPPASDARPDDYEAALAPLYAFAHSRAQTRGAPVDDGGAPHLWAGIKAHGRRRLRGEGAWRSPAQALLGGAGVLGALGVLRLAGLTHFRANFTPGEIGRAGREAMGEVVRRLGVDARHVIFGHTHRAGPLHGEPAWASPGGARLHNAGGWVYEPDLIGADGDRDPFWPGHVLWVDGEAEPRLQMVLGDRPPVAA